MITLIKGSALSVNVRPIDMIFTDPPFEMGGKTLFCVLNRFEYNHLLLICSMHQALELYPLLQNDFKFGFDLVISHISPKKSRNYAQPNMLHSNVLYFYRKSVKSAFDRRKIDRHDVYSDDVSHYYPSIFHAPKHNLVYKYQKNQDVITDLVGSFDVKSILDPFAGSGTTALGCYEHNIDGIMIEQNDEAFEIMKQQCKVLSLYQNQLEIITNDD